MFSTSTGIHQNLPGQPLHYSVLDSIDALAHAGFSHADITWNSWCQKGGPMAQPDWRQWVDAIGQRLAKHGMAANQAHTLFYHHQADPETLAFCEKMVDRCLQASAMLGAPWTVMHILRVIDLNTHDPETAMVKNREYFAPYGEKARKYGVGIAIENGLTGFYHHAYQLKELLRLLNDDVFGICWDTGHGNLVCQDQAAEIRALGKDLKALHLNDNHGVKDEHLLPFSGTVDFSRVVPAIEETGFSGVWTLESGGSAKGLPDCLRPEFLRLAARMEQALGNLKKKK